MIYEDEFGDIINTEQLYKCNKCGWIGTVKEMVSEADCGDEQDAIYSDYCCPECLEFYLFISYWRIA